MPHGFTPGLEKIVYKVGKTPKFALPPTPEITETRNPTSKEMEAGQQIRREQEGRSFYSDNNSSGT